MYSGYLDRHTYSRDMRKQALDYVFSLLVFDNPEMGQIMHDCYLINMGKLIKYAHENHIDELYYISTIRDVLLKSGGVHLK